MVIHLENKILRYTRNHNDRVIRGFILAAVQPLILSLAHKIARRYPGTDFEDLWAEGNLAVLMVMEKYHPVRKKFSFLKYLRVVAFRVMRSFAVRYSTQISIPPNSIEHRQKKHLKKLALDTAHNLRYNVPV